MIKLSNENVTLQEGAKSNPDSVSSGNLDNVFLQNILSFFIIEVINTAQSL